MVLFEVHLRIERSPEPVVRHDSVASDIMVLQAEPEDAVHQIRIFCRDIHRFCMLHYLHDSILCPGRHHQNLRQCLGDSS